MNNIIDLFIKNKTVAAFLDDAKKENFNYFLTGVSSNHNYLLTYATYIKSGSFVIYVASNVYKANIAYEAFCRLAGQDNVNLFVVDEFLSLELAAISNEFKIERLNTLKSIANNEKKIIVTHTAALLRPLGNRDSFKNSIIRLKTNNQLIPEFFINNLIKMGYTRTATTNSSGEFSVRGEVIDVFSSGYSKPIRINLFDIEIETIKYFDVSSQKTTEKIDYFEIYPLNEIIIEKDPQSIREKIISDCDFIPSFVEKDMDDLLSFNNIERLTKYIRYIDDDFVGLLDYLDDKIVFYDDLQKLEESYLQLTNDLDNYLDSIKIPKKLNLFYFFDYNNIFYNVNKQVHTSEFKKTLKAVRLDKIFDFNGYLIVNYQNDILNLCEDIKINTNKTYLLALENKEKIDLLAEVFGEKDIKFTILEDINSLKRSAVNLVISKNALGYGFYNDIEVITDTEIFKHALHKKTKYRSVSQNIVAINSKEDLEIGDYVVHYDYGIGRYTGIKTVELNNIKNDYIKLQYENMELFIPVEKVVLLEKYQGSEG
ncbi:MAG: CarD family transcriptional regulator, partial [Bacilli bacterium]|nr:CarD family transcriptional regulator [Bacilli bacterium]